MTVKNIQEIRGKLVRFFRNPPVNVKHVVQTKENTLVGVCVDVHSAEEEDGIPNFICTVRGLYSGKLAKVDLLNQYLREITKEDLTPEQLKAYNNLLLY